MYAGELITDTPGLETAAGPVLWAVGGGALACVGAGSGGGEGVVHVDGFVGVGADVVDCGLRVAGSLVDV